MNKKLISFVKYNKSLLFLYRLFGNFIVVIIKPFIPIRQKQILFVSFGGQKFDDSPMSLFQEMVRDTFFKDFTLIWAFSDPKKYKELTTKKIKIDTLSYYITAMSSHIWITNSSIERGLDLKRSKTIEINTWHGTPLKKMGDDIKNNQSYSVKRRRQSGISLYCAQSQYDRDIFVRLFHTLPDNIIISDLPRNDALLKYSENDIDKIKEELRIPKGKKILLYAPTFREYDRDSLNACYIKPPVDFSKWKRELESDYVLLFRAHYEIVNIMGIQINSFIYNVSQYPRLNDLIAISDILISDYSSIYFDYAITEKPMLNFAYDLKEYETKRGLYLDLNKVLPCNINICEDTLLEEIKSLNFERYREKTKKFREQFAPFSGHAVEITIERLKNLISKN
jgi:CDP-glycerol glycerophosphotransferase